VRRVDLITDIASERNARLAAGALRLAARRFTPEACFADLLAAIEAPAT
jgi:hypothetical protein